LQNSPYAPLLDDVQWKKRWPKPTDFLHPNSLQVIENVPKEARGPFRRGNWLISLREISSIIVVDPRERKVVWALKGAWRRQHEARFLSNGHLLLFNNFFRFTLPDDQSVFNEHVDYTLEGTSQVLELDPENQQRVWSYSGDTGERFFSALMGANQRLPNGNTLITESDYGRAFEVTREGRIVWEFYNPHTKRTDEGTLVAVIPELRRLPADYFSEEFKAQRQSGGNNLKQ
jgi:hypothetical protein